MGRKVVHFEVIGKDGKKLQEFYAKLFDWKIDANNPLNSGQPGDSHVMFYVEVEDLHEHLKKAERLGGKTILAPADVPGGPQLAMFADPEGHVIGMIKAGPIG